MHIAIPKYFSLYNADKQEVATKSWRPQGEYYTRLTHTFGKASECIDVGSVKQHVHSIFQLLRTCKKSQNTLKNNFSLNIMVKWYHDVFFIGGIYEDTLCNRFRWYITRTR